MSAPRLTATLAWVTPEIQELTPITVAAGTTIGEAIALSGIAVAYDLDLSNITVGIFGERRRLDTPVCDGDRIELCRPLRADPKETRRRRAQARRVGAVPGAADLIDPSVTTGYDGGIA